MARRDGAAQVDVQGAEWKERWEETDAVLCEVVEIVRAARARYAAGEEAQASILIDAACRIADGFEQS